MRKLRRLFVVTLILGIFTLGLAIFYPIAEALNLIDENLRMLNVALFILLVVLVYAFTRSIVTYLDAVKTNKQLRNHNLYNLGAVTSLFNFELMEQSIKRAMKREGKGKTPYVVAFTIASYNVVRNTSRNPEVIRLNGLVADFLDKYFINLKPGALKTNAYCFYHGLFVVYTFDGEKAINDFMREAEAAFYKIVEENDIHIFISPFFGVYKVEDIDEEVYISVDNAMVARNVSEANFEKITRYSNDLKKASANEVEELAQAIDKDEFVVFYQPKYSLEEKKFTSSEALVRWKSPTHGLVSPGRFIPIAELGGLIHKIDVFVFKRVCEDLNETRRKGRRLLPVSVNFSLYEFYSPEFLTDMLNILNEYNIDPKLIEIEITETTSQANSFMAVSILKKIKERGLNILMDDFGIGYSNINNLNKLPIDKVKIDKSYIDNIAIDDKAKEIVRFLINLCKTNGLEVIAEGVDNNAQVDVLKKIKCDTIQGYFYSKPLPKEEYEKFLVDNPFEKKAKGGN